MIYFSGEGNRLPCSSSTWSTEKESRFFRVHNNCLYYPSITKKKEKKSQQSLQKCKIKNIEKTMQGFQTLNHLLCQMEHKWSSTGCPVHTVGEQSSGRQQRQVTLVESRTMYSGVYFLFLLDIVPEHKCTDTDIYIYMCIYIFYRI